MPTRRAALGLIAALPTIAVARHAVAGQPPIYSENGIAIRGADPVAYFREGRPVAGSTHHALNWDGATWLFASAANREAFEADPKAYAPRYGGYCAYAMCKGALAPIDPDAWTIHRGRLYLNYSVNVRTQWRKDIPGNIALANSHWPAALMG